jgi:hypothetical protein
MKTKSAIKPIAAPVPRPQTYAERVKADLDSMNAYWDEILRQSPKQQRAFLLKIGAIKPDGSLNMVSTNDHVPLGPVD